MECIQKERDRNLEIYSNYKKGFYLLKELESRIEGNLNPLRDLEYLKCTIDELEKYRFYNLKEIPVKLVKKQISEICDDENVKIYQMSKRYVSVHAYDYKILEIDIKEKKINMYYDYNDYIDEILKEIETEEKNAVKYNNILSKLEIHKKEPFFKTIKGYRIKKIFKNKEYKSMITKSINSHSDNLKKTSRHIEVLRLKKELTELLKERLEFVKNEIISFVIKNNQEFKNIEYNKKYLRSGESFDVLNSSLSKDNLEAIKNKINDIKNTL